MKMKTVILFASKYGTTGEIARRIASRIDGAIVHDLKQGNIPNLAEFDCVIAGSPVYAGMVRREIKTFLSKNINTLREKKLGLFICGLEGNNAKTYFESNFSREILQTAKATGFLGGIFDPKKTSALERLILKIAAKTPKYIDTIDDAKIEQFVSSLA